MERYILLMTIMLSVAFALDQNLMIEKINNGQKFWKAGHNKITTMGDSYKHLLGSIVPERSERNYTNHVEINAKIPKTFDARKKWHYCPSLYSIKNQGQCGSCWAVATMSAASDRLCIATEGRVRLDISAENLLACCSDCVPLGSKGCDAGYPNIAWDYLKDTGVVTGSEFGSHRGCQPYELCPTFMNENDFTPECHNTCTNKKYRKAYNRDKHYAFSSYVIPPENVQAIQSEILKHGPVVATFLVYTDFKSYESGVYHQTTTELDGGHAVKILGWGTEGRLDYWLVANSWGDDWGDNGVFKIIRGNNECGFESFVTAGLIKK